MKLVAATLASICLIASASAQTEAGPMRGPNDIRIVAPALEKYTQERLLGDVWKRPGLSARDRSIVTFAVLIARNQTIEMPYYLNLALDNGVMPREISAIITHPAFYSCWADSVSAVAAANEVFAQRPIGTRVHPSSSPRQL